MGGTVHRIPRPIWEVVNEKLEKKKKFHRRQGERGGDVVVSCFLRKFHYDITKQEWVQGCGCVETKSLFFEYIVSRAARMNVVNNNYSKEYFSKDYISIQFVDGTRRGCGPPITKKGDEERNEKGLSNTPLRAYNYHSDTTREKMLRSGLESPFGETFYLLGCSNSQIKEYSFIFRRANNLQENEAMIGSILGKLDSLERNKGVAKRVKYTGLLFSGVRSFMVLPRDTIIRQIESIEVNNFDFTDGPGLISMKLARAVKAHMGLSEVPSIFQIRYGGFVKGSDGKKRACVCKGILLVDPTQETENTISFRKSMMKVPLSENGDWVGYMNSKLGIVDFSRNKIGKMNQQLVCLMSANIPPKELLQIQKYHLDMLRNCWHDPLSLGYIAAMEKNAKSWYLFEQLLHSDNGGSGGERLPSNYIMLASKRTRYYDGQEKLQIHLCCSRILFGTAFPELLHDFLGEGQCLVFTDRGILVDTVIVSRSPSYSPGDIRVLDAVDLPNNSPLQELRNCIIFATQGSRPEPDKMSGGDLDGDMFLVIWDKRLTKHAATLRKEQPADYAHEPAKNRNCDDKGEDWIAYAARSDNSMLGIVDSAFYKTAKEKGIKSVEANTMNKLFSSLVDRCPASIQEFERQVGSIYMSGGHLAPDEVEECIWENMLQQQIQFAKELRSEGMLPGFDDYLMFKDNIVSSRALSIDKRLTEWYDQVTSCVNSRKVTRVLNRFKNTKQIVEKGGEIPVCAGYDKVRKDLHSAFTEYRHTWSAMAKEIFGRPLAEWDRKRGDLLRRLQTEQKRKYEMLRWFDSRKDQLIEEISIEKKRLNELDQKRREIDLEKEKRTLQWKLQKERNVLGETVKKKDDLRLLLKEKQEKLDRERHIHKQRIDELNERLEGLPRTFMSLVGLDSDRNAMEISRCVLQTTLDNVVSHLSKTIEETSQQWKASFEIEEQLKSQIMQDEKHLVKVHERLREHSVRHFHNVIGLDLIVEALSKEKSEVQLIMLDKNQALEGLEEQRSDLLSGRLRSEIQFEAETAEATMMYKRLELEDLKVIRKECTEKCALKRDELNSLSDSVETLKKEACALPKIRDKCERYLAENGRYIAEYYREEMMSRSSYQSLRQIARQFDRCEHFWNFGMKKMLPQLSDIQGRDDSQDRDRWNLMEYFRHAEVAYETIIKEKQKCENIVCTKIIKLGKEADELSSLVLHLQETKTQNQKKRVMLRKKLTAVRKQLKREGKSKHPQCSTEMEYYKELEQDFSVRIEELTEEEKIVGFEIEKKHLERDRKEKEKFDVERDLKMFLRCCEKYEEKAAQCLNGELKGKVPRSVVASIRKIVLSELSVLQGRFAFLCVQQNLKKKKEYDNCDLELNTSYSSLLNNLRKVYSPRTVREVTKEIQEKEEICRTVFTEWHEITEKVDDVTIKCNEKEKEILLLESKVQSYKGRLEALFCEKRLQSLEDEWQDTGYEDSIQVGINHVNQVIENVSYEWKRSFSSNQTTPERLRADLEEMNKTCLRVCQIEENRLLGFPREQVRKGRMPVYDKRAELQQALSNSNVVIVTAGTGCGKSTQLPQYITDDFYTHTKLAANSERNFVRICCTQPRRLAAQKLAERVAEEYLTNLGNMVGYRVGMSGSSAACSQMVRPNTRIEFVTEGWLLHRLTKSPALLNNYDCIILDEAHERNLETDLLLALLKRYLAEFPSLKVVVMSATIDPAQFCEYFGNCPAVDCPGKIHPVMEYYRPMPESERGAIDMSHAVDVLFTDILHKHGSASTYQDGDVLMFLSGSSQITTCVDMINARALKEGMPHVVAYPLYAQMTEQDKNAATDPSHRIGLEKARDEESHERSRKIICSTNIAETSLTIDRIRFVIEAGHAKKLRYDHSIRSKALAEERVSKAAAKQRRGRAGRTAPGWCYYLYSREIHEMMKPYETPQIMETPVDKLILYSLKVCDRSVEHLGLLDCPDQSDIDVAKRRLTDLALIENKADLDQDEFTLTEDGKCASRLAMIDAEAVRMILESQRPELNCLQRAIKLGAIISCDDDIFFTKKNHNDALSSSSLWPPHELGDHFFALSCFEQFEKRKNQVKRAQEQSLRHWCRQNGFIFHVMDRIQNTVEQCYKELKKADMLSTTKAAIGGNEDERLLKACISGYFSHIAESVDPDDTKSLGFTLLTPTLKNVVDGKPKYKRLNLLLGKESCVNNLLPEKDDHNSYDGCIMCEDEEDANESGERDNPEEEKDDCTSNSLSISFILYGTLLSITTRSNKRLILIRDASIINGKWIETYAPKSWRDRIQYDPNKPSVHRATIAYVGRYFLKSAEAWYDKEYGFGDLRIRRFPCKTKLRLYGEQDDVCRVKQALEDYIEKSRDKRSRNDSVIFIPANNLVAYQQQVTTELGFGLTWKEMKKRAGKESLNALSWFCVASQPCARIKKFEEVRYWRARPEKSNIVLVFINGGDATVFRDILQDMLPTNVCLIKVINDKLEVRFPPRCNRFALSAYGTSSDNMQQLFIKFLSAESNAFLPETVNDETLQLYMSESKIALSRCHWGEIWNNLSCEWNLGSVFWRGFCSEVEGLFKNERVKVTYVPSRLQFEIFATKKDLRVLIKDCMMQRLVKMCSDSSLRAVLIDPMQPGGAEYYYSQWKVWEIMAKVREMRLQHPSVRFTLLLRGHECGECTTPYKEHIREFDKYSNFGKLFCRQGGEEDFVEFCGDYGVGNFSRGTDFEHLEYLRGQGRRVTSMGIMVQCVSGSENIMRALKAIEEEIRSRTDRKKEYFENANVENREETSEEKEDEKQAHNIIARCCMCRRIIDTSRKKDGADFGGGSGNAPDAKDKNKRGWHLTFCGCSFCRECFFNSVAHKLKLSGVAQCQRCDNWILAADCENIIKPMLWKKKMMKKKEKKSLEHYEAEWCYMAKLAIGKFCVELARQYGNSKGSGTCQDCGTAVIYENKHSFLYCRNSKCSNRMICSRCGRVPRCPADFSTCRDRQCEALMAFHDP